MNRNLSTSSCLGRVDADGTRRGFLKNASAGFGWLALNGLLSDPAFSGDKQKRKPHFSARAKSVVFCFMDGGPSHVDTFDLKPMLKKFEGKPIGGDAVSRRSQSSAGRLWLGSPWQFKQRGQSGLWVSDLFPRIAEVADELCVVTVVFIADRDQLRLSATVTTNCILCNIVHTVHIKTFINNNLTIYCPIFRVF